MNNLKKKLTALLSFAMAMAALPAAADYPDPDKPITIVVAFPAGGNAAQMARLNADVLEKELGVKVVLKHVTKGAHIPSAMAVKNAPADGYTLLNWTPLSFLLTPLKQDTPYDVEKDFIPLMANISASNALYVRADSPYQTFEEFIEGAKKEKLTMGVNNFAAPPGLGAVQLEQEFGLEFKKVKFGNVPKTMAALIGGQVDAVVGQVASIHGQKEGTVRPLIILDNDRANKPYFDTDLPGVRTVGEAYPGKKANVWVHGGLAVKAGTPPEIVEKLLEATAKINSAEFRAKVPKSISYHWFHGPDAIRKHIAFGREVYSPLLESLGALKK